ncbi:uncharacterized protein QC763_0112580 [Podospora pseudopauciseta]|uniref:Uncharacterized protein n=2 Tax=Podospora TaxID=5144 RepID=A0ABR0H2Y6_9PEZI|nr:hypothetical protein QC763_0112580 [Podospora pseudopauciseta]KAK4669052.1 hypothetical protein QC764_0108600 [Podospora pseudoanserina]
MPSTTTQRRLASQFVEATNASRENAQLYLKNANYDLNAAVNRSVSLPFTHIRISLLLFPLHFVTAPALSKLVALAMAVPPPPPLGSLLEAAPIPETGK